MLNQAKAKLQTDSGSLQKRAEPGFKPDANQLLQMIDALGEGVVVTDLESRILYANPRMAALLGHAPEGLLGKRGYELFLPRREWQKIVARNKDRARGLSEKYEMRLVTKSGEPIWMKISATPFHDAKGKVIGTLSLFSDIDARKKKEAALNLIIDAVTSPYEESFFEGVTRELATRLGADLAFITECIPGDISRVRTIAYWKFQSFEGNRAYNLENTVCESVVGRSAALYPSGLCKLFPKDKTIRDLAMESFVGVPLLDCRGNDLGHVALMSAKPFENQDHLLSILKVVGTRIAAEMERNRKEDELRRRNEQLRREIEAHQRSKSTVSYLRDEIRSTHNFEHIIGESEGMQRVLKNVRLVAETRATVLIQGETGTGKELVARAIHHRSARGRKPLIKVNCAALPADLIESELFGHEKGAFTGALAQRKGRFELAQGGTLFLDEVGELTLAAQAKLLRVLQDGEFDRVGGVAPIKVDVRLIAATNRKLEKMVENGLFRSDLYYRLNVFPIAIPPLRERVADIEPLARHFAAKVARRIGRKIEDIHPDSLRVMRAYDWPGNIRELENLIERSAILCMAPRLVISGLEANPSRGHGVEEPSSLEAISRAHIAAVLQQTNWVIEGPLGAARTLDLKPSTLRYKMRKLGLNRPG